MYEKGVPKFSTIHRNQVVWSKCPSPHQGGGLDKHRAHLVNSDPSPPVVSLQVYQCRRYGGPPSPPCDEGASPGDVDTDSSPRPDRRPRHSGPGGRSPPRGRRRSVRRGSQTLASSPDPIQLHVLMVLDSGMVH